MTKSLISLTSKYSVTYVEEVEDEAEAVVEAALDRAIIMVELAMEIVTETDAARPLEVVHQVG